MPARGARDAPERIGSSDKTLKAYQGLYHEILNEPEREQVLDDLCAWLSSRVGEPAGTASPARTGNR